MNRRTKIVCTVGPAIESEEMLEKMFLAGMNVARFNFSHGTHEEHEIKINRVRKVSEKLNKYIGVLLDTKGPEIRTGMFENGGVMFNKGDIVTLVKDNVLGTHEKFQIMCPELFNDVKVDDYLLIDDGKMRLTILDVSRDGLKCRVENPGMIKSRKGVNVPNVKLSMPFLSKKDIDDITFGCKMNVDIIALSFVRRAEDVKLVKALLAANDKDDIEVIAKIENQEGVDNLKDILEVADGIMVARGDLGVEVSTQLVPVYQKAMIKLANEMGKPVITATHMLESMMTTPRPTRAEASDVANAILDGTDAIMLSGESAVGDYPVESVLVMDSIATATENIYPYRNRLESSIRSSERTKNDAIGISVSESSLTLPDVGAVVAFTETGGTPKRICKFRPNAPIIACTDSIDTCRKLSYYWGVYPYLAEDVQDITKYDEVATEAALSFGIKKNQSLIITSGYGQKHGHTNTMRIIELE